MAGVRQFCFPLIFGNSYFTDNVGFQIHSTVHVFEYAINFYFQCHNSTTMKLFGRISAELGNIFRIN